MVGVAGFEPTTSPTPRVCASQTALYSVRFAIIADFSQIVLNAVFVGCEAEGWR